MRDHFSAGSFLHSSTRFVWRVVKRAWGAAVLWLLDLSDIYQNYLSKWLSEGQRQALAPWADIAQRATPYVIGLIVLGAILYTFYEVDRQVVRPPKVGRRLKLLYAQSGELLRRSVESEAEVEQLRTDTKAWLKETDDWISKNMEQASKDRFNHFTMSLPYQHRKTFNTEHQKVLNTINVYRQNLHALIESQEWR